MSDKNASAVVEHEAPVEDLHSASLVRHATADVGRSREFLRRKRLLTLVLVVGVPTAYLWFRILTGDPLNFFNLPTIDPLRGSKAHVGALLDRSDTAEALVAELTR